MQCQHAGATICAALMLVAAIAAAPPTKPPRRDAAQPAEMKPLPAAPSPLTLEPISLGRSIAGVDEELNSITSARLSEGGTLAVVVALNPTRGTLRGPKVLLMGRPATLKPVARTNQPSANAPAAAGPAGAADGPSLGQITLLGIDRAGGALIASGDTAQSGTARDNRDIFHVTLDGGLTSVATIDLPIAGSTAAIEEFVDAD